MKRLLLISNSTLHGSGYLEHCRDELVDFLDGARSILFVGWALHDLDGYAAKAQSAFAGLGVDLTSIHRAADPVAAVDQAQAIFTGGGNTFRLLTRLYEHGVVEAIRARVGAGTPYIGTSAGSNVATANIKTTNDMPIVQPPSFDALALVPFNINPHYLDPDPSSKHMGETREQRIAEFHEMNDNPVVGLREGCMLRVEGATVTLKGVTDARVFRRGEAPQEFAPPADLSWLLA